MDLQTRILLSYTLLALIVIAIFVAVGLSSRKPQEDFKAVKARGYAVRRVWFFVFSAVLVAAFFVSLSFFPYAVSSSVTADNHYPVVGRQFSFEGLPATIPIDTPVVFDVTAADVNHGFAVYDPADQLIGQVQAMPGYDNHLQLTFTQAGMYTVRCLEYCGIGHDVMRTTFEVK